MKFTNFIRLVFSTIAPDSRYRENWHVKVIADRLQAALAGNITRLIINAPPRTLKSTCVSVAWPAWILGQNPRARIIVASYSQILSEKLSLDTRCVLQSPWYGKIFPEVEISREQNTKRKLQTTKLGYRFATSVGGSLTGEGGNFLILDDPMNPLQAESSRYRRRVCDWFSQSFMTRLNDRRKGVIVIVMHRLHEEDLTGHILGRAHGGGKWQTLMIPFISGRKSVFYSSLNIKIAKKSRKILYIRQKEEALKKHISQRYIEQLKREVGTYVYASQYQQAPVGAVRGLVKYGWLQRYQERKEHSPDVCVIQSWDTSSTAKIGSDYSACTTWAVEGRNLYLLDVHREKLKYVALKHLVQSLYIKWRPGVVLIEEKASGYQLVQELDSIVPIVPYAPCGNKLARVMRCIPTIQAGYLFLPEYAMWLQDFEDEICSFPHSIRDDQVDSTTQAILWSRETLSSGLHLREL